MRIRHGHRLQMPNAERPGSSFAMNGLGAYYATEYNKPIKQGIGELSTGATAAMTAVAVVAGLGAMVVLGQGWAYLNSPHGTKFWAATGR